MINHAHESRIADLHRRRRQVLTAGGTDRIARQDGEIPLSATICVAPPGGVSVLEVIMVRILIVDDEPDAVELLREFLAGKNYEVSTAANGEEALRKVKTERPHMILLDVRMPGMNGLEVLRRVRQFDQEVGVIIVTAVNEEETGREALKLGAFDFIVKPLNLEYLERSLWTKITTMLL
jgi:CheY-like chemotaxis protein